MKRRLLTGLMLILGGCQAAGPNYQPPATDPPGGFVSPVPALAGGRLPTGEVAQDGLRGGVAEPAPPQPPFAAANWWQGFEDPQLDLLIGNAITSGQDVQAARARLAEAAALARGARAGDSPQIDLGAEGGGEGLRTISSTDRVDRVNEAEGSWTATLGLLWPVDLFGRTRRAVEAAEAEWFRREALARDTARVTAADMATYYIQLRGDQRRLDLLRQSVDLQESTLGIVETRYETGLAPQLDLSRAQAAIASLRAELSPLQTSIRRAANAIATLSGRYPGAYEEILSEPGAIPVFSDGPPVGVPADVLQRRPDVQAAEADLRRAVAEIGVAEADLRPRLQIPGQVALGTTGIGATSAVTTLVASLSALVQQTLFDGGARRAEVAAARARADEALAVYRDTLLTAIEEVEAALSGIQGQEARRQALAQAVEANEQAFSQAEGLYRQGLASFLDVLDAQRELASSRQALAVAETALAQEIVDLFRAAGYGAAPPPAEGTFGS